MAARKPYFKVVNGIQRSPDIDEQVFEENLHFRARKGDVVQCTYIGCGSKWLHYITILILRRGQPLASKQEFSRCVLSIDHDSNVDQWVPEVLPLRLFVTRLPLSRDIMRAEAKYVCLVRNPWDVCVSYFHRARDSGAYRFEDGTFEEFFDAFLQETFGLKGYIEVLRAAYALRDEPNVLLVTYEELTTNTAAVVLKLAAFLGERYDRELECDKSIVDGIVQHTSSHVMRDLLMMTTVQNAGPDTVSSQTGHSGDNRKFKPIRSAKVGEWRKFLTAEQLRRIEAKIQAAAAAAPIMHLWGDIKAETIAVAQQ